MVRFIRAAAKWVIFLCLPFGPVLTHRILAAPVIPPPSEPLASIRRDESPDPLHVTHAALRKLARAWPRTRSGIPTWRDLRTDRFSILTDARAADSRWLGYALEWALDRVSAELGVEPPRLLRVTAFADREQFEIYRKGADLPPVESLYDPARRQIVLCMDEDRARLMAPITHELVHAVMHDRWGRTGAPWLAEGVAERVVARVVGRDEWAGQWPADAAPSDLMKLTPREFQREDAQGHYALALSWVRHLIEVEGIAVRELLEDSPKNWEEIEHRWRARIAPAGGN